MRVSLVLSLIAVGWASLTVAETEPSPTATDLPSATDISVLNGAALFNHLWTHNRDWRQLPSTDIPKELAKQNSPASRPQTQSNTAKSGRRRQFAERIARNAFLELQSAPGRERQLSGRSMTTYRSGDGLGPLHNATSCADCHPRGGAAGVDRNVTLITIDPRSRAITLATDEHAQQVFDVFPGLLNEQGNLLIETIVHNRSTRDGYHQIRLQLAKYVPGGIDDAWFIPEQRTSEAIARDPVIAGRHGDVDFYLSQRNPPPLFGLGLIDQITPHRLACLAKEQAEKTEGRITGRVAMKFGWRGQIPSLSAFVSQACAGELGLTQQAILQPGDPASLSYSPPGLDMTDEDVEKLTRFVSSLPPPTESPQEHTAQHDVFEGESIFNSVGCADCHVPDVPPVLNLFSDLLLHDMGAELQAPSPSPLGDTQAASTIILKTYSKHGPFSGAAPAYYSSTSTTTIPRPARMAYPEQPQFPRGSSAVKSPVARNAGKTPSVTWDDLQRDWRTPPLWGVADTAPYLHDGRAETLEAAILWHGGESQISRDRFAKLGRFEKRRLLAFLSSLRAPHESQALAYETQDAPDKP